MIHRLVILIQKSPENHDIEETTDYTDYTDFFILPERLLASFFKNHSRG
jgi:hypothetical protein